MQNQYALEDLDGSVPLHIPDATERETVLMERFGVAEEDVDKSIFHSGLFTDSCLCVVRGEIGVWP